MPKSKYVKVTLSVPRKLLEEFDKWCDLKGRGTRSSATCDAWRNLMNPPMQFRVHGNQTGNNSKYVRGIQAKETQT